MVSIDLSGGVEKARFALGKALQIGKGSVTEP
jgi:hypothetical protein